jgi:hypothetical protein
MGPWFELMVEVPLQLGKYNLELITNVASDSSVVKMVKQKIWNETKKSAVSSSFCISIDAPYRSYCQSCWEQHERVMLIVIP